MRRQEYGRADLYSGTGLDSTTMAWIIESFLIILEGGCVCPNPGTSVNCCTPAAGAHASDLDSEACTNCMLLLTYCPDSSIEVKDGEMTGIDLVPLQGLRRLRERMQSSMRSRSSLRQKPRSREGRSKPRLKRNHSPLPAIRWSLRLSARQSQDVLWQPILLPSDHHRRNVR